MSSIDGQVPKYVELLIVEEPTEKIFQKYSTLTDRQVSEIMSPSDDVKLRREETQGALEKLSEAQDLLYNVSRMDSSGLGF